MRYTSALKSFILSCIILILSTACQKTASLNVQLQAKPSLNLSAEHESLPVRVRIYQLSNLISFQKASFEELWKNDGILGNALVSVDEYVIAPKSKLNVRLESMPQARYVGAVALFREPYNNQWRSYKHLNSKWPFSDDIHITLQKNKIQIIQQQ